MSLIHEKLYHSADLARIDFDDYLHSLLGHLTTLYAPGPGKATLHIDVEPAPLNLGLAVPCGLIINELVSNAFKHAFPDASRGTIFIGLHRLGDGRMELSVVDDGIGLPAEVELARSHTLGLKLVATLTRQIDGELAVERSVGTAYRVRFHPAGQVPTTVVPGQ
jgi:two-component sensor histidine kinase